jgi:hypothetical protein
MDKPSLSVCAYPHWHPTDAVVTTHPTPAHTSATLRLLLTHHDHTDRPHLAATQPWLICTGWPACADVWVMGIHHCGGCLHCTAQRCLPLQAAEAAGTTQQQVCDYASTWTHAGMPYHPTGFPVTPLCAHSSKLAPHALAPAACQEQRDRVTAGTPQQRC